MVANPSVAGKTRFALAVAVVLACQLPLAAQPKVEFNRDVRPILAENCFACHGPDSAARKAGLRLDQREDAIKIGAIAPGKVADSALVERITATDPKQIMPPVKSHKKLTAAQKETLKQ